jgi:hypothetical protein
MLKQQNRKKEKKKRELVRKTFRKQTRKENHNGAKLQKGQTLWAWSIKKQRRLLSIGLEPTAPKKRTDFKSIVYTNFTKIAEGSLTGGVKPHTQNLFRKRKKMNMEKRKEYSLKKENSKKNIKWETMFWLNHNRGPTYNITNFKKKKQTHLRRSPNWEIISET